MHDSIRDRLEDLLERKSLDSTHASVADREALQHLHSCAECSEEVNLMREHASWLQSVRAAEGAEPAPGFYARVMERIETRAENSIWSVFIDSPFGKRLAYASLTLALLLGTYVVSVETEDGHFSGSQPIIAAEQQAQPVQMVAGDSEQQRDAVLVNFASYQE